MTHPPSEDLEYSLFLGDPLWRLLGTLGLGREGRPRLVMVMPALAILTWGGLAAMVGLQGVLFPGSILRADFFRDFSAAAQFLVAIPLFVAAEVHLDWRARSALAYVGRSLVRDGAQRAEFQSILTEVHRLRRGYIEWLPVLGGYLATVLWIRDELGRGVAGWYLVDKAGGGLAVSLPGWYVVVLAMPLLNGYCIRWGWKTLLWCRSLWRLSRLDLRLSPDHPDGMAGLGILSWVQMGFALVAFALGVVMSATVGYKLSVQTMGVEAIGVWLPIVAFVLCAPVLFLAPLLCFTRQLLEAKQQGLVELGELGLRYAEEFATRSRERSHSRSEFLDLSSQVGGLTALEAAYHNVAHMKIVPFDLRSLSQFLMSAVAPLLPLVIKYIHLPQALLDLMVGASGGGGGH